jgi:hypothetical protein
MMEMIYAAHAIHQSVLNLPINIASQDPQVTFKINCATRACTFENGHQFCRVKKMYPFVTNGFSLTKGGLVVLLAAHEVGVLAPKF